MKKINIAIDGYSSTGKSSMARALSAELGYRYIDTGAMYRGVTLYGLRQNLPPEAIGSHFDKITLNFKLKPESGASEIYLNGENVEAEIRGAAVANQVSKVAAQSAVRRFLVAQQRAMATEGGVVMDGRDIGTVVLPQADLKIFMTADPEERAKRRFLELQEKGHRTSLAAVAKNLRERDAMDTAREDSPLRCADDARTLNNTHLNLRESLAVAKSWVQEVLEES